MCKHHLISLLDETLKGLILTKKKVNDFQNVPLGFVFHRTPKTLRTHQFNTTILNRGQIRLGEAVFGDKFKKPLYNHTVKGIHITVMLELLIY